MKRLKVVDDVIHERDAPSRGFLPFSHRTPLAATAFIASRHSRAYSPGNSERTLQSTFPCRNEQELDEKLVPRTTSRLRPQFLL